MEKFSTSLRGYNKEEVNKFVDDCIVKVDNMLNQLKQKDLELETLKHDLVQYKNMEATFNKAILVAEDASNQIKRMARDESSRLIDDAKSKKENSEEEYVEFKQMIDKDIFAIRKMMETYND